MKLYIDDADLNKIKPIFETLPVDGITTNPSILKRNGKDPIETLKEIREYIGPDKDLFAQVISTKAEDMVKEAKVITDAIGKKNTVIKVPSNAQGIKACQLLKKEGYTVCATAIYSTSQGMLAANAGADILSPYISRIDNLGGDGIEVCKELHEICKANNLSGGVGAASFKSAKQVIEMDKLGVKTAAISVEIWNTFLDNAIVDAAVQKFNDDFGDLVGKGKTYLDYKK